MPAKNFLNNLTIPTPCDADWNSMIGNDRVRFCEHCNLDVHNISLLTRNQTELLIARANGQLCVRYHQDASGKPLTLPASKRLQGTSRRVSKIAAGAFAASLSVTSAVSQPGMSYQLDDRNSQTISQQLTTLTFGASIEGVVKDQNGAVIPGAIVSLWREGMSGILFTSIDSEGRFKVQNLAAGIYRVRIQAPGFSLFEVQVEANESSEARLDCTLQIAAIEETVITVGPNDGFSGGAIAFVGPVDPFIKAAQQDDLETFTNLMAGRDVNRRDERSETTALEHAVRNANREMVQLLIAAGVKVNAKNSAGETALMMFDKDATSDLLWDLINAGAEVNLKDEGQNTALMRAASTDNLDAIRTLIEAGAEINARNKFGTALMRAASEGSVNIVRALVIAGADLNVVNEDGDNALSLAIENNCPAVVRFLKSKGAVQDVSKAEKQE